MKKIITNTILKKFIWTTLLIMIVFQVCFPSLALAKISDGYIGAGTWCADTYENWINEFTANSPETVDVFIEQAINNVATDVFGLWLSGGSSGTEQNDAKDFIEDHKADLVFYLTLDEDDPTDLLLDGVWHKDWLVEGTEYDDAWENCMAGFPGENEDGLTFWEYVEWWKSNRTKTVYLYQEFKNFIEQQNDDVVYPLIEEKLQEFIKSVDPAKNFDDVIDGLARSIFNNNKEKINIRINERSY